MLVNQWGLRLLTVVGFGLYFWTVAQRRSLGHPEATLVQFARIFSRWLMIVIAIWFIFDVTRSMR